jgi:hypothetical protein
LRAINNRGIKFDKNQTIWKNEVDKETGEVLPSQLFTSMDVGEGYLKEVNYIQNNRILSNSLYLLS